MRFHHLDMKVTWKTAEVLGRLRENRGKHAAVVVEARKGYVKQARAVLSLRLAQLEEGKATSLRFALDTPVDNTDLYDTVIEMLEGHERAGNDSIELSSIEVRNFVMDEWDWSSQFLMTNAPYSASAADLANEKGLHTD